MKKIKGITLMALVITIIVLLILAGVVLNIVVGDKGLFTRARAASKEHKIAEYKEQIELIKSDIRIQNNGEEPSINQIEEEIKKQEWVKRTEIIQDKAIEKLKVTSKEGYIFYVTSEKTEYKGEGEVVDTSALEKSDVINIEIVEEIEIGKKVKITKKVEEDYYKIKYQINSKDGEWLDVENDGIVEVPHGGTIYVKLMYETESGKIHELKIEDSKPTVVAKNLDTSSMKRKTDKTFEDLFDIKWGSDGIGDIECTITGKEKFNTQAFSNNEVTNLAELELGTYNITCKITSPTKNEVTAQKEVKITTLADERVTNDENKEVAGYGIYSRYDLMEFRDLVNAGNANINAKQKQNIDVNPGKWVTNGEGITTFANDAIKWQPIGTANYNSNGQLTANKPFNGIYDGGNNEINGIYINDSLGYAGLFGYSGGTIKNISLNNSTIIDVEITAGIVNWSDNAKILNCKNYANIKGSFCVGGICGVLKDGKVEDCENYGRIEESKKFERNTGGVAGIVGYAQGDVLKSRNYGDVKIVYSNVKNNNYAAGGIIGRINGCQITNCANQGDITTVGNVAGGILGVGDSAKIESCYNTGDITTNSSLEGYAGGITSYTNNTSIANCYNMGKVTSSWAAGIVEWMNSSSTLSNCYQIGNTVTSTHGSHLIVEQYQNFTLTNNYITGDISKAVGQRGNDITVTATQVQSKSIGDFTKVATDTSSVTYLLNKNNTTTVWAQGKIGNKLINSGYPYLINNVPKD